MKKIFVTALFLIAAVVAMGEKAASKDATLEFDAPKPGGNTFIYSPIGKRDPFKAPQAKRLARDLAAVNPLERFNLEQLHLRAILKGLGKNKAMFEDPEGKTHILQEGATLGRERASVSRILNTEVILTVRTFNYLGQESINERVVSLPSDEDDGDTPQPAMPAPKQKRAP